jgi:hypothetical protein
MSHSIACPVPGCNTLLKPGSKKHHDRTYHQSKTTIIKGLEIQKVDGDFHCPVCDEAFPSTVGFYRHGHVKLLKSGTLLESLKLQSPHPPSTRSGTSPAVCSTTADAAFPPSSHPVMCDDELFDPMDEDPAPVVHASAGGLFRLHGLDLMNLAISRELEMLICEDCGVGLAVDCVAGHWNYTHHHSKLPLDVKQVCDQFNLPNSASFEHGQLHSPIPSIPILEGVFCTYPDCGFVSRTKSNALYQHVYVVHKGHQGRPLLTPCSLQLVYSYPAPVLIRIDPNDATASLPLDLVEILSDLRTQHRKGRLGSTVVVPPTRQITPFLNTFNWLEMTEGKDYGELAALVEIPKKAATFKVLEAKVDQYFKSLRPDVKGCSPLALQWINTPSG